MTPKWKRMSVAVLFGVFLWSPLLASPTGTNNTSTPLQQEVALFFKQLSDFLVKSRDTYGKGSINLANPSQNAIDRTNYIKKIYQWATSVVQERAVYLAGRYFPREQYNYQRDRIQKYLQQQVHGMFEKFAKDLEIVDSRRRDQWLASGNGTSLHDTSPFTPSSRETTPPSSTPRVDSPTNNSPSLSQIRGGAVLQPGQQGDALGKIQTILGSLGYSVPKNNRFDESTQKAVRDFQKNNRVQVNGLVGPTTLKMMDKAATNGVTLDQLRKIMPSLSLEDAKKYLPYVNAAMVEFDISTDKRKAAFLAQIAHESGELKWMEELASGRDYEGRRDLGNVYRGDGVRYKGRGAIQLTGRSNYKSAGAALGLDLVNNPTLASRPENAFRIAGWYWKTRELNPLADRGNFNGITYRINGGYRGKWDRIKYYNLANKTFKTTPGLLRGLSGMN